MNCQDIARILDDGDIRTLDGEVRLAVENHLAGCPACARVWKPLLHFAQMPTPAMPRDFADQCATLVVADTQAHGSRVTRIRLVVIGSLAALAAAAGILAMRLPGMKAGVPPQSAVTLVSTKIPEPAITPAVATLVPSVDRMLPQPAALPLLPRPGSQPPDLQKSLLVLQKLVERHPQLVEGPAVDDRYVAVLAMRADGTVLSSAVQLTSTGTIVEIEEKLQRTLPVRGIGESFTTGFGKQFPLSDGRALRASVSIHARFVSDGYEPEPVPDDYDPARSDVRVREILGHKYDQLLLPDRILPDSAGTNLLTVFLSQDGRIEHEKVQHFSMDDMQAALDGGVNKGADQAGVIAGQLGLNVEQIGLTGMTVLEDGTRKLVVDQIGNQRMEGEQRTLPVLYAWARMEGESAPNRSQAPKSSQDWDIDLTIALAIVERLIPDAFTNTAYAVGEPTVVLTAKGEVIRAGRVRIRLGVSIIDLLREQLVPGASIKNTSIREVRLVDKSGASARVRLVWVED